MSFAASPGCSQSDSTPSSSTSTATPLWGDFPNARPSCVKGIHLTAWYTATKKGREQFEKLLADTELNTVVIDVKESEGDVYVPGVKIDGKENFVRAIPDLKEYLKFLKDRGVYTIARIVVFHDDKIAKVKPEWAIHASSPIALAAKQGYRSDVWVDHKGSGWADPTNVHVWDYNIEVAVKAVEAGFQEIEFDYIRFPSDGPTKLCIYSKPHKSDESPYFLATFLEHAAKKIKPLGAAISIDVFGLTGSYGNGMGIGQKLSRLLANIDAVSPMMYPSHYNPGEYGLKDPDSSPYETLNHGIRDTKKVLSSTHVELRPWLQDFSLRAKYTPKRVRDQIDAAADNGIYEWLLWNASCHYTYSALAPNAPSSSNEHPDVPSAPATTKTE